MDEELAAIERYREDMHYERAREAVAREEDGQMAEPRYVQWFMTEDTTMRIVGFEWWRDEGQMVYRTREHPSDTWGPPEVIARGINLATARLVAEGQGFTVEEEGS